MSVNSTAGLYTGKNYAGTAHVVSHGEKGEIVASNASWVYESVVVSGMQSFLKSHGLKGSMSRRGNCLDNTVAENFFQLLKREREKKDLRNERRSPNIYF